VEPDAEKAVYWFQKLAELDNPTGQFILAIQYVKGEGAEHSFEKALYWMEKAEENGEVDEVSHIEIYKVILDAIDKANEGDADAMAILSEQYMNIGANIGFEHEDAFFTKSFEWAQKATEQNNLEGTYLLGLSYEHGRGTDIDTKKAVEAYRKAAKMGHDKSQWNLAVSYIQGMGIEKNIELAQYWAEKSAEQGYLLAIRGLFVMTEDFFEGDLAEKMEKLECLAQQCPNDAEIYHRLALDYMEEDDEGNMYNLDRAIYWFKLAGENGHQMSGEQYHLWSYIKKIKQEGIIPDDGDYLGYVIGNGLLEEALAYEPEN
jgi:TPR repeat protein